MAQALRTNWPPQVIELVDALNHPETEVTGSPGAEWTVSVPVGYLEAVEADWDESEASEGMFVSQRAWAPDHGLNHEVELGQHHSPSAAAAAMRRAVQAQEDADERLERLLQQAEAATGD